MANQEIHSLVSTLNRNLITRSTVVPASDCQYTYNGVVFVRTGNVLFVRIRGLVNLPNGGNDICNTPEGYRLTSGSQTFDNIAFENNATFSTGHLLRLTIDTTHIRISNYGGVINNNNANVEAIFLLS